MEGSSRPPAKLQKRKSRERNDATSAHMSGALNTPSANTSQPLAPNNMSAAEKERRSKWRMSNPFHSKDKYMDKSNDKYTDKSNDKPNDKPNDKSNDRKERLDSNVDSAYGSSEPSTSANPSFASNPRPASGEQWHPTPLPTPASTQAPTTSITAPTPPAQESYAPPPNPVYASQENISRETHQDIRTGNIVTTVTTTTTTTTTTTGPGGSTVVQQPVGTDPLRGSITSTTGPSPPSPAPPVLASYQQNPGHYQQSSDHQPHISIPGDSVPPMPTYLRQGQSLGHTQSLSQGQSQGQSQGHDHDHDHSYDHDHGHGYDRGHDHNLDHNHGHGQSLGQGHSQGQSLAPQVSNLESSSPPLPTKSNIRNRVELDSVSPGVERPNPMADPVSPMTAGSPTRANFSYPARAPPQGVPRHVPSQHFSTPQQPLGGSRSYGDLNHPAPVRVPVGQGSMQTQDYPQRQSTLANLKLAAAGIHGAGETLRGTFNDTFDRRYGGVDSAAHAKNLATIQAGRSEIEAAQFSHRSRPSLEVAQPPFQPQPLGTKTPYQGPPVSGSQIEGKSGKLNSLMRKMKDGSMVAIQRPGQE
ncbi:hypothetical protein P153DRAFT_345060 [Dothidotthia symphoricarpi CBS 119687]|uniref:Uncharacterized protein n=1 Tax=Dothidotthia symphoricarpi CBS 119687 TaxID=1392245 RepID=A0A6A6A699_9PLEO|nr:uncharacterized protein P153DRAFT_345060 [Dothidotthia symphoricarpi CBS 119687]KAF2127409.1 hypothetical protein P153DRAFT_345060 [Dothidotthia symphoricarpi CBS 119687]